MLSLRRIGTGSVLHTNVLQSSNSLFYIGNYIGTLPCIDATLKVSSSPWVDGFTFLDLEDILGHCIVGSHLTREMGQKELRSE